MNYPKFKSDKERIDYFTERYYENREYLMIKNICHICNGRYTNDYSYKHEQTEKHKRALIYNKRVGKNTYEIIEENLNFLKNYKEIKRKYLELIFNDKII